MRAEISSRARLYGLCLSMNPTMPPISSALAMVESRVTTASAVVQPRLLFPPDFADFIDGLIREGEAAGRCV